MPKCRKYQTSNGNGGASEAIVKAQEMITFGDLLKKHFYDLPAL